MLMLSSPTNPETRYLYEINDDNKTVKLNRKIHLPEIAGDVCIGSCPRSGFIFSLPTRCSPDIVAINPLTGTRLPLPPTSNLPQAMPHDRIILPDGVTEVREQQGGRRTYQAIINGGEKVTLDLNYISLFYGNATLSPSLDMAILTRAYHWSDNASYFASLTSTTPTWNPLPFPNINKICDAIFHKNHIVFVNEHGTIVTFVDSGDPLKPQPIVRRSRTFGKSSSIYPPYLVESPDGEDLFLVRIMASCIEVFRLDTNDRYEWKEVYTLGGLTFFVGTGRSISLPAADHPGRLKPDSIYYAVDVSFGYFFKSKKGLGNTGVYNLKDHTAQHFQLTDREIELTRPPPIWVVPDEY